MLNDRRIRENSMQKISCMINPLEYAELSESFLNRLLLIMGDDYAIG